MARFRVLVALAGALLVSACASVPASGPVAGAPQAGAVLRAPATDTAAAAPDLRAQALSFVRTVGTVEPVAEAECLRLSGPARNCDFRIVVDDRPGMPPNAFQTVDSAGRPVIAFTLALIAEARNADELAFVMAHEAAHHIAGHLERQNRNATLGAVVFGQLASALGTSDPEALRSAQELGAVVGARTYSQDFELEADELGTIIAIRAGYDPLLGAAFFDRIPDPGDRFLGTHPPNAARIATVRQTVAAMGF